METSLKNVLLDAFWIMPATPKYKNQGLPYITSKNIKNRRIDFNDVKYIDEADYDVISRNRPILENDILISMIGTLGEVAVVKKEDGRFYGQNMYLIRLDESKVSQKYFLNWVESDAVKRAILQQKNKSTQSYLKAEHVEGLSIKLLSVDEQNRIADIFERINQLTENRKQQLQKLDELVKARFVEMFGDPMGNPMEWERVNISNVVSGKVSNGFFAKRDDYCDDGNVKVLGVTNIVNRMYSEIDDLPKTNGTEMDIAKYGVKYGDMLFCRSSLVAEGIGKASVVPKGVNNNILFECHVIRLPLNLQKCVPEFMQVLSTTKYFREQVVSQAKTATMTTIGQDGILKTDIVLPPLDLQLQFLQLIEQIYKSKLHVQKSLDKLEILKKALMQKYFG